MSSALRRVVAAVERVEVGALAFVTAMAMLGIALALVLVHPGAPLLGGRAGTQHHLLLSPYQARPFNRGQAMVSSSRARGRSTPRDVAEAYQRLGYTWLSITDVNTVDPTAGYTTPGIVSLQGEEMVYGFGHFLVYGSDHDELAASPAAVVEWAHRSAGLAFLSRPLESPTLDAATIAAVPGLDGIELYDARLARDQPALADASALWDQLLTTGHRLTAIAGDDSLAVVGAEATAGQTSVDVQVAALSPPLIEDALKRGAFVDSTGVRILGIDAADGTVTVVTADAEAITFIGRDGRVLARTAGTRGQYRVRWDEKYVRAVATRADGARAWTMPVWLVP